MCGRYGLTVSKEELEERYEATWTEGEFTGQEEIFPTTDNTVLLPNQKLYRVKWGFTPSFAKRPLINARSETILEKKTFKEPFSKKRCLIPATYFFEWQKVEGNEKKEKKRIQMKDLPIFSMAGICERYTNENGKSQLTCSILTTEASEQMASIHDRMPVILEPEDEQFYLNLDNDPKEVQAILKPSSRRLEITHVS